MFRIIFWIRFTLCLQWFCQIQFPDSPYIKLKVLIAECVYLESHEKKKIECHSKERRRQFSKLSFKLALTLWLQLFCRKPFPVSTYFELKVLIAEWATLEIYERKHMLNVRARTERAFSKLSFELALSLWLQYFYKKPYPDSTYFELQVLIAKCVTLESHFKKNCWMSQQRTEKSILRVIFRINFDIMITMILQKTIFRFNLFQFLKSFDIWVLLWGAKRS